MTTTLTRPRHFGSAIRRLAPRARVRCLDWFRDNIQTHEGRPYDHDAYPHLGAPGGPCDAFDDSAVRTIWMQFGSRLGKTFFGQSAQLMTAAEHPCPMMFASSDQKTATDVAARTYGMIANCRKLKWQLRPPKLRKKDRIDLAHCRIHMAWSRSVSTLADKAVKVGHASEIDKWEHKGIASNTATEADPLKLFHDRGKEYPSRKFICESTPAIKNQSRVEHGRLGSTNCSYFVPCPHCEQYQRLRFERIVWDKTENGRHDKELARSTAHYLCAHCQEKILDHHRGPMMRAGVWVPEGCGVDSKKAKAAARRWYTEDARGSDGAALMSPWQGWRRADWITGRPARDGVDAGYQLSSLYAIVLSWGDIAAEFVACKDKPQDLRNFINQWLGETWNVAERKETWMQLGERLVSDVPHQVIPQGYAFLTCAVDKQEWGYVYVVDAWGDNRKVHTLDYGDCETLDELRQVLNRRYRRIGDSDPSEMHGLAVTFIDSGHRPKGVIEFCREMRKSGLKVLPVKGSSSPLSFIYRVSIQGRQSVMPGAKLVLIDTATTQDWIESHLSKDSDGMRTLFAAPIYAHQDYLEQLLNDAPTERLDHSNNSKIIWARIDRGMPNDYRDCERYNLAAMMMHTRGGSIRQSKRKTMAEWKALARR